MKSISAILILVLSLFTSETTSSFIREQSKGFDDIYKQNQSLRKAQKVRELKKTSKLIVSSGESIQDALDCAGDGDTIIVKPGVYVENSNSTYGLRIIRDNIKLYAYGGQVRIIASGVQETGIYVAPEGCEYTDGTCESSNVEGFFLKGFSVEGFPSNGIQTRWVNNFKIIDSASVNNLNNGIYPTYSSNGIIENCTSSGSLDSGLWVAGSLRVKVVNCSIYNSVTGLEITVSKDVYSAYNEIHDNVVGVGCYHANMAGTTPDFPSYDNWVFENNKIFNNNQINNAPAGSFQSFLPSGIGMLFVGVRGHTVNNNIIEGNQFEGILIAGFCSVLELAFGSNCEIEPPRDGDPSVNYNTIINNTMSQNGGTPAPELAFLPSIDIVYGQTQAELGEAGEQNCFLNNTAPDGSPAFTIAIDLTTFDAFPLPTDACFA